MKSADKNGTQHARKPDDSAQTKGGTAKSSGQPVPVSNHNADPT